MEAHKSSRKANQTRKETISVSTTNSRATTVSYPQCMLIALEMKKTEEV